jgi:hypothetical protein
LDQETKRLDPGQSSGSRRSKSWTRLKYDFRSYLLVGFGDHRLSALLGFESIRPGADHEDRLDCLCCDYRAFFNLLVFASSWGPYGSAAVRWASATKGDEQLAIVGDNAFAGCLDMKTPDPAAMKPGTYREAYNVRIEAGGLVTRFGSLLPGALNYIQYNQIYGVGLYSDPNGLEWNVIGTVSGVWFVRDGEAAKFVPLEESLSSQVEFVQAFDKLFLFRGADLPPLEWGGDWAQFWDPFPPPTGGRASVPNSWTAEFYANRLLVPYSKDRIAVSDLGDYTMYDWTLNDFQINTGQADSLIRIFPWIKSTVLMFKSHSIFLVSGVSGDLSNATLETISTNRGLVGERAVVDVGNDVYFMDFSGVYQIAQVFETSPQVQALPISEAIKPVFDSINWQFASGIRANTRRDRLYFAVPLKNAMRPNVLLVYNLILGGWESIDTFEDTTFRIDDLVKMMCNSERRLFAVDRQQGKILLLEQGKTDMMGMNADHEYQIRMDLTTRGYLGPGARSNFQRVQLDTAEWNSRFNVDAYVDGTNAKAIIGQTTNDRTKYQVWGKPKWDVQNLNDDHANAYRQDYSVQLPLRIGYNGVEIEREQEDSHRARVQMFGRYCQLRITNDQGSLGVRSIIFEGFEDQRQERSVI